MIHRHVVHNGKLLPIEQVRLSPGQAGLLNGWGLFTTVRLVEGEPFAFERHWNRLQRDAVRTHLPLQLDREAVRAQLRELARINQVREGCARVYLIYNTIGFWRSDEPFPDVDLILYTADLPSYREPCRLALREHGRHAGSPLAGVKTTAWLNNTWNLYEAQQQGCDEVVLLNERGEVAECTAANIFCVREGRVLTPPLDSGCLEGVTRAILLEIGPQAGVRIEEQTLHPEDLYRADEVFLSSTNRNLLAVGEIAGRRIPQAPGPVTRKLDAAFASYVQQYVAQQAARSTSR
ncbi:MAG: aminotransferase class IV [Acidobacteriia bacterium]|jgi:branched-chain amino acid aminotransferase|nr:aminotransferase class IV [Terriglobia bacterium]